MLICQSGKRSHQAVELLRRRGMAQPVQELQGGIANWKLQGRKLERAPRTPLPLMQQVQIAAGVWCGLAWPQWGDSPGGLGALAGRASESADPLAAGRRLRSMDRSAPGALCT